MGVHNRSFLIKTACKRIEGIVENLVGILELLKKENDRAEKEMTTLVLCKQKVILVCDAVLLIFRDVVTLKYMSADTFTPKSRQDQGPHICLEEYSKDKVEKILKSK